MKYKQKKENMKKVNFNNKNFLETGKVSRGRNYNEKTNKKKKESKNR